MRFSTSHSVPRPDISLVVDAVEALRTEWAGLHFATGGVLVNPISGDPVPELRLVEGRHRSAGARYEVVTTTPAIDPAAEPTRTTTHVTLRRDDARRLDVTVSDLAQHMSVDVDVVHGRLPRIDLHGWVDGTAVLKAGAAPGCLSWLAGGQGRGGATIDLPVLEASRRGTLVTAKGRYNRFRADATADLHPSPRSWDVDATARLRGKGLGRLALLFLGTRIQQSVDSSLAAFWTGTVASLDDVARDLPKIRAAVTGEGGIDAVVHRLLWEPGYADHLTTTYGLE
jgi:hypothetical protein